MVEKKTAGKRNALPEQEDRETRFIRFMFGERAIRTPKDSVHKTVPSNEKFGRKNPPFQMESGGKDQNRNERMEFFQQLNQIIESASKLRAMTKRFFK
ncbi:hypothetical protein [Fervidibacillus halotolerans]|uniref:Uncharacterized protein n=1 Tax=Fervidibacillus halotolerans TaxID=2980027 RepID=A0A9E8M0D0_9BACI|nr:hypothetical protein [Fervidibacillus halotolerans]WAA13060.1 hypothetical protein OE105_02730 [Fervidibacillus halotolerans]